MDHHDLDEETIDDIEHPTWVSFSSFSESCGSCLSKISSLCLDGKADDYSESSDARDIPGHNREEYFAGNRDTIQQSTFTGSLNHMEVATGFSEKISGGKFVNSGLHEEESSYAVSGSLQSLYSSTKTVNASPRLDCDYPSYDPSEEAVSQAKAVHRRNGIYRERAPSVNALDFQKGNVLRNSKLSRSLHDVSSIPSNGLKKPSQKSSTARASLSTLYSRNRSRDSGFVPSDSMLSLSSGSRNYDHVQSKVKQYIQSIKNADALGRSKLYDNSKSSVFNSSQQLSESNFGEPMAESELAGLVAKLQQDIREKDEILSKLQKNYNNLLEKYAEAKNINDKMRLHCSRDIPSKTCANKRHSLGSQCITSNPLSQSILKTSSALEGNDSSPTSSMSLSRSKASDSQGECSSSLIYKDIQKKQSDQENFKKEVVISAPLRPISSLYCTSVRLDKVIAPLKLKSNSVSSISSSHSEVGRSGHIGKKSRMSNVVLPDPSTEASSCPHKLGKEQPIGQLPHDDPILKVQRWQKSLNAPSYSADVKRNEEIPVQLDNVRKLCSQTGVLGDVGEMKKSSATSQKIAAPMIPSSNEGKTSEKTDICRSSFSENRSFVQSDVCDCGTLKKVSPNLEALTSRKHTCEARCSSCGFTMKLDFKQETPSNTQNLSCFQNELPPHLRKLEPDHEFVEEEPQKLMSQMNSLDLAKLISLIWKDHDHVVPTCPEEEHSFQHSFKNLKMKLNALKCTINLKTLVSFLDLLLEKLPAEECNYHDINKTLRNLGSGGRLSPSSGLPSSTASNCCGDDQLLQCLDELDDFSHQVFAKTESCLRVLDSNECKTSRVQN